MSVFGSRRALYAARIPSGHATSSGCEAANRVLHGPVHTRPAAAQLGREATYLGDPWGPLEV